MDLMMDPAQEISGPRNDRVRVERPHAQKCEQAELNQQDMSPVFWYNSQILSNPLIFRNALSRIQGLSTRGWTGV